MLRNIAEPTVNLRQGGQHAPKWSCEEQLLNKRQKQENRFRNLLIYILLDYLPHKIEGVSI